MADAQALARYAPHVGGASFAVGLVGVIASSVTSSGAPAFVALLATLPISLVALGLGIIASTESRTRSRGIAAILLAIGAPVVTAALIVLTLASLFRI
jgi:hypothetical protein